MRRYETIYITLPELSEEDHTALEEKLRSILINWKGDIVKLEDWGTKKLSYEIRKNTRGRFFIMDYLAEPDLVRELERNLRLNDRVLKYQTVKISSEVSPETAKTLKETAAAEKTIKIIPQAVLPEEQKEAEPENPELDGVKKDETPS